MRALTTAAVFVILSSSSVWAQEFTKAIEDNSYFIEEAYNQEDRVVQHIFNGAAFNPGNSTDMSFTQEWPAFGRSHQLSITLPFTAQSAPAAQGLGDMMLNYRYQMIDEPGLAFSPRVSVILPTGDEAKGFGTGSAGLQMNLPLSKRFSNEIVAHANAGVTVIPDGVTVGAAKETYSDYFAGVSTIYLANQNFNVMLEALLVNSGSAAGRGTEVIMSPGVRWAIDIGELQIVPGLAFPFSFVSGKQTNGFFFYLSFEHPY
jgi:hypothetical protein